MKYRIDRQELTRLYDQHSRALAAYACSVLRDYSAAEDILHQVFLRLLRGDIEIDRSPVTYLYSAVRNAALNYRRQRAREVELPSDPEWLESPVEARDTAIAIQAAIWELPLEQREIVVLRVWGEVSFEAAAEILGISPNTAASRYRYGLTKLREQLKTVEA